LPTLPTIAIKRVLSPNLLSKIIFGSIVLEWAFQYRTELLEDWELCDQHQVPKKNTTVGIVYAVQWRLTKVKPLANYMLEVEFVDGTYGFVDMSRRVASDKAGVFAVLKDISLFNQVYLECGVVTWPGEIDLAPDAMYDQIRSFGKWVLV
jgi:hypothetical protein